MTYITAIIVLCIAFAFAAPAAAVEMAPWRDVQMDDASKPQWRFIGAEWSGDDAGSIVPPHGDSDGWQAINTEQAYGDFEAEFDFRLDNLIAGCGFIFRARDAQHYYLLHFPTTGQQYRAEHFWAAISKVDASGYAQELKHDLVLGVPSEIGLWHHARLVVQGDAFTLWVNGRPWHTVRDETYTEAGYIGFEAFTGIGPGASCSFRNLKIRGPGGGGVKARPWDDAPRPQRNYFYPTTEQTYGPVIHLNSIARAPNGDLLLKLGAGDAFHGKGFTAVLIRSTDHGRTWSKMHKLFAERSDSDDYLPGTLFGTSDGGLYMFKTEYEKPVLKCYRATCTDETGEAWSDFELLNELTFDKPQNQAWMFGGPTELIDGTLLWAGLTRSPESYGIVDGNFYENQQMPGAMNFVLRSTDGGTTWQGPFNTDGRNPSQHMIYAKDNHPSEGSVGQTAEGRLVYFVRPITSPWMWESWSDDGGETWTPAARGPFPMWACSQVIRTASGVMLINGRHPAMAVRASWDSGMTWKAFRIDTTFWANGTLFEVEPNVVMSLSTAKYSDPKVRALLFRVTDDGLKPIPVQ